MENWCFSKWSHADGEEDDDRQCGGCLGSAMKRLLLLGLDGGDIDFIESRAPALPCMQEKLKSGKLFKLDTPKALSGSVWPTFYNGVNPGIHGIYQHLLWDPKRMGIRRIGPNWCYYKPFWQTIENQGHKAIVLDVPYSFPVSLKKGIEITDWATHGQTLPFGCNQKDVKNIIRRIEKNPIGRETPIQKTTKQLEKIQKQLIKSADLKGQLIIELMKYEDWNLFVAIFAETHRGGHIFFNEDDESPLLTETPLLKIYQAIDQTLAKILSHLDNETAVVIFSVHGMARDYAQGHMVRPLMARINETFLQKYCKIKKTKKRARNSVVPYLRKAVPSKLQYAIGAASPDSVRQWVVEKEIIGGIDWSSTPGFALRTDIRTEIRLNLRGRESQGILEPNSEFHHEYVKFLEEVFLSLCIPNTNDHIVDELVHIHDLFPGPKCEANPDLVITWHRRPTARSIYSPLLGTITAEPPNARGGDHTDCGFAITPKGVSEISKLEHITDLAVFCNQFFNTPTMHE